MGDKPICPLLTASALAGVTAISCQREKCAWWVEDKQKCAIAIGGERNGKR